MFLIDDILSYPVTGILSLFRELHNAAEQEAASAMEAIRAELSDLYVRLEAGQMTEAEFDTQESALLDQLDALEAADADEEEAEGEAEFAGDEAAVEEEKPLEQDAELAEHHS